VQEKTRYVREYEFYNNKGKVLAMKLYQFTVDWELIRKDDLEREARESR